jgi:hypothetical protein
MKQAIVFLICLFPIVVNSQSPNPESNPITTAVPFIAVPNDARGAGMGMAGVATLADINSMFWNPAKYAFITEDQEEKLVDYPKDLGLSASYHRSYLKELEKAKSFQFSSYKSLGKQTIAATFRFFRIGEDIYFTDNTGYIYMIARPFEYAVDVAYARKFSNHLSAGVAFRYIHSDLTKGQEIEGTETKPGISLASDLSLLFRKELKINSLDKNLLSFGLNISNIGNKISYSKESDNEDFIPTNLRLGGSFFIEKGIHGLTYTVDLNKLLVPTPPIYSDSVDASGNYFIIDGMDDNVSALKGMIQSFYDAPNGFKEELQEISYGIGIEYSLYRMVSVRTGYFTENKNKGDRKYFNIGAGFKYKFFGVDLTYSIIPNKSKDYEGYSIYERNIIYANLIFQIRTTKKQNSENVN